MKRFRLVLTFLTVILISVSSLSSIAKFDVHVLYFKPTDAADIDHEYHDKIMKDIQKYYQLEMTRHGFTDKTFPLETDENGKLVIHTINAKHDSEHYDIAEDRHWDLIEPELPYKFNNERNWNSRDNVHLIIVGGLEMNGNWDKGPAMGFTWHGARLGGNAVVNMDMINDFPHHYLGVVAHELGHAFALDPGHNNHNNGESLNGTVIAWGDTTEEWGNRMQMTKEEAILLDSRPIFRKINLQEGPPKPYENINVLMYPRAVSWISLDDANRQSQITKQLLSSEGIQAKIVQTEDAVKDWMLQTTSDGNVDVLILYGTLPTSIYPSPNSQLDGSVAENWIESTDGNTILNHSNYFGYVGSNGVHNGVHALQAIMDIPYITMWDFGLENNTPMIVTKDGKEVTPSLTNFASDRAFHLDELTGDWFAEKVLASNTGTSQATRADPVIVRDGNLGRIGIVYQTFNEVNPKGKVAAELIANFLLENNNEISLPPLEPITEHTADAQAPIRGPWLWMIAPTEPNQGGQASTNVDSLSAASGGRVTETNVATNGAQAGNIVGNYAWTPGGLPNNGDINAMLIDIGMTTNHLDDHSSYALITVVSGADLRGVPMGASSNDAIKIWINGEVVHTNAVNRERGGTPVNISGYQDRFSVNLNRGSNLLMVKVSERGGGWGMYVGIDANVTYRLPDAETVSNVLSDTETTTSSMEFRVKGGTAVDYIDSQGRVWWGAQKTNQTWGGWVGNLPQIAQDPTLTAGARAQATAAGYDSELFLAVSWALYPNTVKYQFKTGNGVFDVTYLVGEHWSPNARGFDIIIEDAVVEPLYITPGIHEIDIRTYEGIEVRDGTLDLEFSGNPATGVADLNGMFSALEVVSANTNAIVRFAPDAIDSPRAGEQLSFNIDVVGAKNILGYQATVNFDETALRFTSSENGDYLPTDAFAVPPIQTTGAVTLGATSLSGESSGDGTLATLTFEVIAVKASTLTLSDVLLSNSTGETFAPQVENAEVTELKGDVNGDGVVNIADLVLVASNFGKTGQNAADVNGDGVVNIADLVLVAGALGTSASAPSLHPHALEMLTATDVKQWLSAAQQLDLTDTTSQRGILFLQQLLIALTPKETALLPNYPNPFNPETWIPYHLAKDADVTLHIYAVNGTLVRTLVLGHQAVGVYQNRSHAAYWDGKNEFGESVASGVYFYTLTTGDFTATRKMLILK